MRNLELTKKVMVLREMQKRINGAGIVVTENIKNILEYLYNKQNREGYVYMSLRDMILQCNLEWCGKTKESLLYNVKRVLYHLEDVLEEYSAEQIQSISDLNELLIIQLSDEFR